jgi:putative Mg2+ transporter-C (MgtC) family protein
MIPDLEVILRVSIAALLGAAVGFERERQGQPAGLRTHMILVIGAALMMTLSINLAMQFQPMVPNGDPARLAAQVVSGIGFLGAGAILRYGATIKGLTTATSLWTMAGVGLAVGAGHILVAVAVTLLILAVLILLNILEKKFIDVAITVILRVESDSQPETLAAIHKVIQKVCKSYSLNFSSRQVEHGSTTSEFTIKLKPRKQAIELLDAVTAVSGVKAARVA